MPSQQVYQPLLCGGQVRKEIRVEEPHWGVRQCLQLYPEFSYSVQPLSPYVREATPPPCGCHPCISTTLNFNTHHLKRHAKMQEHVKWTHKKAETFQAKEAQCHKQNYNKRSKVAALEVGDMVLVCVSVYM